MFSSQAYIFRRTLPSGKFEQLCSLWQQMAEFSGDAVLIGENTIFTKEKTTVSGNLPGDLEKQRFRILISPDFSALLSGKPTPSDSSYQASITFSSTAIAEFLSELCQQLQDPANLKENLEELSTQISKNVNGLSEFSTELLKILVPQDLNSSSSFSSDGSPKTMLTHQLEQKRILDRVTVEINQNKDWFAIVKMTVEQVQRLLEVDRLVVYQLGVKTGENPTAIKQKKLADVVTYEARASETIPSILNFREEICFLDNPQCQKKYLGGFNLVIDDVNKEADLALCLRSLMEKLQVRSKLVTPIIVEEKLWGFLIAHQCSAARKWRKSDIQFLQQVSEYLAIAIYQASSYQQLQKQKNVLQQQVNKRAKELQGALLAAQAAHRSKSQFIGNMSHELRTPLTRVIGLAGTLLHWSEDSYSLPQDKQRQFLQTIHDSGKQLLDLVNDLLEFSEIEAGKSLLNIKEFSLRYLSGSVLQSLQEKAESKQINLQLDLQVDRRIDIISADRERVEQILFHLLDNAIKFTPKEGTVILRVWRESNEVVFQVEDTGIGISEHQLPLLFEKFQQLEESRQRTHGGTGLGLALAKQLVELHRGRIEVESNLGKGSLFTVWLPTVQSRKPKVRLSSSVSNSSVSEKGTLVLVEQDDREATLICELLTAADYQVIWLTDGASAIKQIELIQPTSVILHRDLPGVYEISQDLKESLKTKNVKVLVLSSQMISPDDWKYMSLRGVDDYLIKPVQPNLLLEKMNVLMSNSGNSNS